MLKNFRVYTEQRHGDTTVLEFVDEAEHTSFVVLLDMDTEKMLNKNYIAHFGRFSPPSFFDPLTLFNHSLTEQIEPYIDSLKSVSLYCGLEANVLPIFAVTSKHTPESCPMFNNEVKQKFKKAVGKRKEIAEKYGVKVISAYTSILDHLIFHIVEAPSQQAVENLFIEAGFAFWNDIEIRQAKPVDDVIKKVVG